ncbi:WecB/TagA/CpsF family glycosyltransferase [Rhodospirillum sp. A1_3_36]|uniref:WecB/TagA/CpsF family glycosyltransferase n=1 Tax=Rhodospirillum sp. A1_3_36 TaxID=3391666 RepID=UPI0039A604C6
MDTGVRLDQQREGGADGEGRTDSKMHGSAEPPKQRFLGLDFNALTLDQALDQCVAKGVAHDSFVYLVTPNVDHVQRLHRSGTDVWSLYQGAWLCLNDSQIIAKLARLRGLTLPAVPGSDLTAQLFLRGHVKPDDPVTLIGGTDAIAEALRIRFGLRQLSHYDPPMGFAQIPAEVEKCVQFILDTPASFVFLAVGSPRQEIVADAVARTGKGMGVGFCIGASFEFLTGAKARAPLWMRKLSLEWLHRLLSDPRRMWRRYLVDAPRIFWVFFKTELLGRSQSRIDSG